MTKHNFYKTGDADAPSQILDRNGEVVLALCRNCNKAEAELSDTCPDPLGLTVATLARIEAQEGKESTTPKAGAVSTFARLRQVARWVLCTMPQSKLPGYCTDPETFEPHDWVLLAMDAAIRSDCNDHFAAWSNTLKVLREVDPEWHSSRLIEVSGTQAVEHSIRRMAAKAYPPAPENLVPRTPEERAAYLEGLKEGKRRQLMFVLKDGELRDLVNQLRQIAVSYSKAQQLRARLSSAVLDALQKKNDGS